MITTLDEFVHECVSALSGNVTGIIYYGSSSRNENSLFSDRDLILTANEYEVSHIVAIHEILKQTSFLVDLPIVFGREISPDPDHFRIVNHGCYFLEVLKLGKVLYGRNVFLDLSEPSQRALELSLFEKLSEYARHCRRNFVEANRERSLNTNYQLNRRLVKSAHDLLWLSGNEVGYDADCVRQLKVKFPPLLSEAEWRFLEEASDPKNSNILASNFTDSFFTMRLMVMEKVYFAAQQLVFPSS